MTLDRTREVLRLHVPADPAQVAAIRSFVGATGRRAGCDAEAIDDLRLALTEACAQAIDEGVARGGLDVRSWVEDGSLVLELEPAPRFTSLGPSDPLDPSSGAGRWALVSALFPTAVIDEATGTRVLRISAPPSRR